METNLRTGLAKMLVVGCLATLGAAPVARADEAAAAGALERAGRALDCAARKTGAAVGTAADQTGQALAKAGEKIGQAAGKVGRRIDAGARKAGLPAGQPGPARSGDRGSGAGAP